MSLYPGKRYVGDTLRLEINVQNEDAVDTDSNDDVILRVRNPRADITTYKYSLSEIEKESTGNYFKDYTPAYAGRHHIEWSTTGVGTPRLEMSSFVVQFNPFDQSGSSTDYGA